MVRLHKPFLEPLGLTFPQYLVILALLDGAPQTVGALGARLDMDTGTITPLVKRLEAAEMVSRVRDRIDERRVLVDLTAASRALESEVRGVTDQIKTACQLDDAGLHALRRTSAKNVHHIAGVDYEKIDDEGVHITTDTGYQVLAIDTVVFCAGQEPVRDLHDAIVDARHSGGFDRWRRCSRGTRRQGAIDQGTGVAAVL